MSRLLLTREVGQTIIFDGGKIQVKFLEVKDKLGNKVIRVRIKADPSVSVSRLKENLDLSESESELDSTVEIKRDAFESNKTQKSKFQKAKNISK